ncbi:hypothetical protein B7486_73115, partial [cyanobacterium TDX16]
TTSVSNAGTGLLTRSGTISANGDRVSFASQIDPLGTNPDGNSEIFVRDLSASTTIQVTDTVGGFNGSLSPALDADGSTVVYVSDRDLDAGQNADGDVEIFLSDVAGGADQLTNSTLDPSPLPEPAISGDGNRVAWIGPEDTLGTNEDENQEIWLHDVTGIGAQQLTSTSGTFQHQGVDLDGAGRPLLATSYDPRTDSTSFAQI